MSICPCGSKKSLETCCLPILKGKAAPTAEALMRARYVAFAQGDVDFIVSSHHPSGRHELSREDIENWSKNSTWKGLEILKSEDLGPQKATVDFIARWEDASGPQEHHELSEFRKLDGRWFFFDGKIIGESVVREEPKIGRNDPCPCGSGKKYKKCCFSTTA